MSAFKRTVLNLIGPRLMASVTVESVHVISEHFRFIDLESKIFRGRTLKPGEKVQINTGDWNMRTYTPVSIDPIWGRLRILAYLHGKGPGAQWAASVAPGADVQMIGPSRSLRLSSEEVGFVFFGDETALAVGTNLKRYFGGDSSVRLVFEASDPVEVRSVVKKLGLTDVEVVPKGSDGQVLSVALSTVSEAAQSLGHVIMAGRAQSIQQMRSHLRETGFGLSNVTVKAYWSEGKVGLD